MANPDDRPATKRDLNELRDELGGAIATNTKAIAANADAIAENKAAILATRHDLLLEIGASAARTANVVIEHVRDMFCSLDDKYRDLPSRVSAVEERLQHHIDDDKRHSR